MTDALPQALHQSFLGGIKSRPTNISPPPAQRWSEIRVVQGSVWAKKPDSEEESGLRKDYNCCTSDFCEVCRSAKQDPHPFSSSRTHSPPQAPGTSPLNPPPNAALEGVVVTLRCLCFPPGLMPTHCRVQHWNPACMSKLSNSHKILYCKHFQDLIAIIVDHLHRNLAAFRALEDFTFLFVEHFPGIRVHL